MVRRTWAFGADAPMALQIAADARTSSTDYADDQVWELALGSPGNPALACFTRYGGRVGMLSVVPMWWIDGQPLYEYQTYSSAPKVVAFAPGYLSVEAYLRRDLLLQAEYRALDSHALGIRFMLRSATSAPFKLSLDLVAFVGANNVEKKPVTLRSVGGNAALSFPDCGNLDPVLAMEGATASGSGQKLTSLLLVPAKGSVTIRAVVAGLPSRAASLDAAEGWLKSDWAKPVLSGARAQSAPPIVETGDADLDALLAFSYQQAIGAFLKPTGKLPAASFAVNRQPDAGFRPINVGDSSASMPNISARTRGGQHPASAYLLALAVAPVQPDFAKGIVLNYLAVQKADGWIDWSPGLDGSQRGLLCLPILARLTWGLYQYTEDAAFLKQVYPGLIKFLHRWLAPDLDADQDGVPEWQSEAQTAYPFLPIFSRGLPYGQNADIRLIESPDLPAYLLSEAISLREMAVALDQPDDQQTLDGIIDQLRRALAGFWRDDLKRYTHRDRDTHQTPTAQVILRDKPANERFVGEHTLDAATRLVVEIIGGTTRPNAMTLKLDGVGFDGRVIQERAVADQFAWTAGRGTYTSHHAFSRIDQVACEGLIPMYKVSVHTLDTSQIDITALLPLWAVDIPREHTDGVISLLKNPEHFWRKYGAIMLSATDPHYQPEQNDFAAGVWGFWLTLLGEGLIEAGDFAGAADLLKRYLAGMIPVVKRSKAFYEGYHAEKPQGIGVRGHIGGIVPLHLFLRVIGVRIIGKNAVWTGGDFVWDHPVTVSHQGVTVRRSAEGTTVTFPSGEVVSLPPGATWQRVTPPSPAG